MPVLDRVRLDGKRLFITGGSRGLGREMALAIADAGADVVLVGRDLASLEKTSGDIRSLGRKAWPRQGDAGVPSECERLCRTALDAVHDGRGARDRRRLHALVMRRQRGGVRRSRRFLGTEFLGDTLRMLIEPEIHRGIQGVADPRRAQGAVNQARLARLPRPEKDVRRFFRRAGSSAVRRTHWSVEGSFILIVVI